MRKLKASFGMIVVGSLCGAAASSADVVTDWNVRLRRR
jgi:hypothetical protein